MDEARYVAEHVTVVGANHKLGVNIIRTSNRGLSMGIGEPRLFAHGSSLPEWEQTEDAVGMYCAGSDRFIEACNEQIAVLEQLRDEAVNRKTLTELLGAIPE